MGRRTKKKTDASEKKFGKGRTIGNGEKECRQRSSKSYFRFFGFKSGDGVKNLLAHLCRNYTLWASFLEPS